jgi:hypothetical protein
LTTFPELTYGRAEEG